MSAILQIEVTNKILFESKNYPVPNVENHWPKIEKLNSLVWHSRPSLSTLTVLHQALCTPAGGSLRKPGTITPLTAPLARPKIPSHLLALPLFPEKDKSLLLTTDLLSPNPLALYF